MDPATILRGAQLRATRPRVAVIEALERQGHLDADAVRRHVLAEAGPVSVQAVYDVLNVLVRHRLARRIEPAGMSALYELRTGDNHHHLICRSCGRIRDVDCAVGAAPCLTADDDAGFDVDEAEITYWGICPDCRTHPDEETHG